MRFYNFKLFVAMILFPSVSFAQSCPTNNLGDKLACEWGFAIDIAVYFAYFLALVLLVTSILMFWSRTQNPNSAKLSAVILTFLAAGFMFSLGESIDLAQSTIFTNKPVGLFEYESTLNGIGSSSSTGGITALTASNAKALIGLIMLIGVCYFIKGIFMISKINVDQQVTNSKVAAHIFGGAACFNILNVSCGILSFINMSSLCPT